jgi:hypothetical protein
MELQSHIILPHPVHLLWNNCIRTSLKTQTLFPKQDNILNRRTALCLNQILLAHGEGPLTDVSLTGGCKKYSLCTSRRVDHADVLDNELGICIKFATLTPEGTLSALFDDEDAAYLYALRTSGTIVGAIGASFWRKWTLGKRCPDSTYSLNRCISLFFPWKPLRALSIHWCSQLVVSSQHLA